ncbi:MAG: NAD-dependent epimerase/dehydratase family protein [bacterium]
MKVLITGVSGYAGAVLLPLLLRDGEIESVVGLDVRSPEVSDGKFIFVEADVRDPEIAEYFRGVDVVVHLAFIVSEIKDKKKIYDINVNGTKNVLEASAASGVKKLVVASSLSAYGSHPDMPEVVTEDTPLRGNRKSYYSHSKLLVERMLDEFERENEEIIVTRLRPSIFCGANANNFFRDVAKYRLLIFPKGNMDGLPVVHEDDVAEAFYLAIKKDAPGAFNIAAGDLKIKDMCDVLKIPAVGIPVSILKPAADILFSIGVFPFSSHWVELGRYPFRVSTEKAERELGWRATKTPMEAFREMVDEWKSK